MDSKLLKLFMLSREAGDLDTREVPLSLEPMKAAAVSELPLPEQGWHYEPKTHGLRCLMFRDRHEIHLMSGVHNSVEKIFPEVVAAAARISRAKYVLDGEIVIPGLAPSAIKWRHAPRADVEALSLATPAHFLASDLLADALGRSLLHCPFSWRRMALEQLFDDIGRRGNGLWLSRATTNPAIVRQWLPLLETGTLERIVAQQLEKPYQPGTIGMRFLRGRRHSRHAAATERE